MKKFDIKTAPPSDLRMAYLNERTWLGGALLKAIAPLLFVMGTLLLGAIVSNFGDGKPEWLTVAWSWVSAIAAFAGATGFVMFGGPALCHFRQMQTLRAELQNRGCGS